MENCACISDHVLLQWFSNLLEEIWAVPVLVGSYACRSWHVWTMAASRILGPLLQRSVSDYFDVSSQEPWLAICDLGGQIACPGSLLIASTFVLSCCSKMRSLHATGWVCWCICHRLSVFSTFCRCEYPELLVVDLLNSRLRVTRKQCIQTFCEILG